MYEVFLNQTKGFIENREAKPFFIYYALHEPHVPRIPNARFVGSSGMGPRGDAILEADYCVGELLNTLKAKGILNNTLIIFSSDNGPVLNDGYYDNAVELLGSHTPAGVLRGGKYSLFDGATKVPFIISWPGKIAANSVSNALVSQLDLLGSFSAFFGEKNRAKDSKNYWSAFTGKSKIGREEMVLEASGRLAFRYKNYAYIQAYPGLPIIENVNNETGFSKLEQLYDLKNDPSQKNNIADTNKKLLSEIKTRFTELTKK